MELTDAARDDVLAAGEEALAVRGAWRPPRGHPGSLALCVVEAVQAPRLRTATTDAVVTRYRAHRAAAGADAGTDGVRELLATSAALGGDDAWAAALGTRHRTSTAAGAPLKAEAVRRGAEALAGVGITTTPELRAVVAAEAAGAAGAAGAADVVDVVDVLDAARAWCAVPGQSSGLSWHWLVLLAGWPSAVPDRHVQRFVARALGRRPGALAPREAAGLLDAAAVRLGVPARELDHAVWRWEGRRGRQA